MYRIGKEEVEALQRVIESRQLFKINGGDLQEVMNCEEELKKLMGVDYALLMTSGKAAMICGLIGLGVGPGDEVIIPAYTYIASAIAVTAVGAIPVICDCDETLTIDVADVERKISKYTKAVIPVYIQGFPGNLDALKKLADKYNIKILEDACQSVGGSYKGKRLGTIGDVGAFSLNFYKVITTGEGGVLFTDNRQIYERALIQHDSSAIAFFGTQLDGVTEPQFCGNEYRVSELMGAILREQLKRLDGILFDLRKNKKILMDELKDTFEFAPSHDIEGDCGTTLPLRFASREESEAFTNATGFGSPINTGKHVYTNWTPIMEKRGAFHPLMDPFKMEVNKDLNHNYSMDMCAKSLDLLARTAYISISPDWNEQDIKNVADKCKKAK
ncbi:MAG: aminotransferase class I/II-fold pyridoxal phosphate-dependent enzyme [Oscillospiraceae bacterium]|nr:aminotransferase class I/II-fold pyridoxal phosphate-dependent enzyme [Oscillospiraceae bacterium]